jgi:hypothetical protein
MQWSGLWSVVLCHAAPFLVNFPIIFQFSNYFLKKIDFYPGWNDVQLGSKFCFVVVVSQNTAVLAIFVQFHHPSPAVGRQHIASFITGLFAIYLYIATTIWIV